MTDAETKSEILMITGDIVAAYVSNNPVQASDLPQLIERVYQQLNQISGPGIAPVLTLAEKPTPAVPINKSVQTDYIVCLEDGKKLKVLKRYLMTNYKMTIEDYKKRWNLGPDYPMVAPSYAEKRSNLAKSLGLGRKSKKTA